MFDKLTRYWPVNYLTKLFYGSKFNSTQNRLLDSFDLVNNSVFSEHLSLWHTEQGGYHLQPTQLTFTFLKLTIEILQKGVKYVQS